MIIFICLLAFIKVHILKPCIASVEIIRSIADTLSFGASTKLRALIHRINIGPTATSVVDSYFTRIVQLLTCIFPGEKFRNIFCTRQMINDNLTHDVKVRALRCHRLGYCLD